MRIASPALLCLALTVPATAQAPESAARPELKAAFRAFVRANPGHWEAYWNAATGTPNAVFGSGIPLADWRGDSLDEARRHAQSALVQWHDLLGIGASDLHEAIAARMGNAWTFTWDQYFHGLPVIGGRADVRVNSAGRIAMLGSVAWDIPEDFDVRPTLDAESATFRAWRALGKEPNGVSQPAPLAAPRLVIFGDVDAAAHADVALAWEISISAVEADGSGPVGRSYVDARSGRVLHHRNDKHECGMAGCAHDHHVTDLADGALPPATYTVMAWCLTNPSPLSTPTNEPLPGVEVVVPGVGTLVTDQNGQFVANLAAPTPVTIVLDGIHTQLIQGSNAVTQSATLQPGVNATIQLGSPTSNEFALAHTTCYLWTDEVNEFCRSILGNSAELNAADSVRPTVNIGSSCNAYYTNNTINFYASGGGCTNTSTASVVAHEWGHGIDDRYGGISQTNGLSEGWGDILSIYLLDDPIVGRDFFTNGGIVRTALNTRQYPTGAGVHDQGESWMGFAWLFRENLRAVFGTPSAIQTSNTLVVGTLAANATNQPNAVLEVFIADDDDGNLANGTPHHAHLAAACVAHSLPYPLIQLGTIQHSVLGNTGLQLTPRLVTADVIPNSGSFTRVELVYQAGGVQRRAMIPNGVANRFQAMLPGILSPATMSYHFEATHSSGGVQRLPVNGEFEYLVQGERRLFFENFEAGGTGWTHGAFSGVDEWEVGVPAGLSGAGWSDPAAAASGLRCAGTDLGIAGDGGYAPSSETWLRSPPIDCSGHTNVRLRFKRWLSVDVGANDSVQMRVGTQLFWLNSASQQTLESGWSTQDIPLIFANNNPSVVLEFRLRTDATGSFGGWNIDDVELYTTTSSVPLAAELRILPEQSVQGASMSLSVRTPVSQAFVLLLGLTAGPTTIPGLPELSVGNFIGLSGSTDASGNYGLGFSAPSGIGPNGAFWFSQVLTLNGSTLETSNASVNLFTR